MFLRVYMYVNIIKTFRLNLCSLLYANKAALKINE